MVARVPCRSCPQSARQLFEGDARNVSCMGGDRVYRCRSARSAYLPARDVFAVAIRNRKLYVDSGRLPRVDSGPRTDAIRCPIGDRPSVA